MIRKLYVFYDGECGLCRHAKAWLESQEQWVPLQLLAYQSPEAARICPMLPQLQAAREMVVMSDQGGLYRGSDGWIMCFWALARYRGLAYRVAGGHLRKHAATVYRLISERRYSISRIFGLRPEEIPELRRRATARGLPCSTGACPVTSGPQTPPPIPVPIPKRKE